MYVVRGYSKSMQQDPGLQLSKADVGIGCYHDYAIMMGDLILSGRLTLILEQILEIAIFRPLHSFYISDSQNHSPAILIFESHIYIDSSCFSMQSPPKLHSSRPSLSGIEVTHIMCTVDKYLITSLKAVSMCMCHKQHII